MSGQPHTLAALPPEKKSTYPLNRRLAPKPVNDRLFLNSELEVGGLSIQR
jgi:hypothetical protein